MEQIDHLYYREYTPEEKVKEIGAIAAIMARETFELAYEKLALNHGGSIGLAFDFGDWAIEFFEKHLDTIWEEEEYCWDELAMYFAKDKILKEAA